ncbi:hypothetical protein SDJN02_21251 [Cucurbita argyrosperma subsp. argyrosperma]|nr:hypothetical protein SDJN02_21251 [Cucurbita argyrosperma subsp. argyrosperma]
MGRCGYKTDQDIGPLKQFLSPKSLYPYTTSLAVTLSIWSFIIVHVTTSRYFASGSGPLGSTVAKLKKLVSI